MVFACTGGVGRRGARRIEEEEEEEPEDQHVQDSVEWVELCDDKGRTHCCNRRTRQSVCTPPEGIRVVWVGAWDVDGEVKNWHEDSRVSTYELCTFPPS